MKTKSFLAKFKRLAVIALVLSLFVTAVGLPATVSAPTASFLIQGISTEAAANLVESYGGRITAWLDLIHGVGASLPINSVTRLLAEPAITAITPNGSVELADKKKGLPVPATDYPDVVGADIAWEQGITGKGVTVAVVDTGINPHPGLINKANSRQKNRIVGWVDFVEMSRAPRDPNGHGTHIAGIIAGSEVGQDGEWTGVAPGVRLVGVRVLNEEGFGTYEQVIQGIQWVIDHKDRFKIKVMNLSLVSPVQSPYWADPINQAVMQAWAQGITVVAAAGNGGPGAFSVGVPGNNPYAITVGAFTDNYTPDDWGDDYITPFSAAGPTLDGFTKPDIVAPGAHMISTLAPGSYILRNHSANRVSKNYFSMAGTSQAAAVVSGIAALSLAHNPDLTPDQVKYRLMSTAFPWVDLETTEALYSVWQQGAGRANAPDAVFADISGQANSGMDIWEDISGEQHYEGFSYYDEATGEFRLGGEFSDWTGGYGAWAGDYEAWTGGYGAWAGGYGAWAGGYGAWAGGYGAWAGGYGAWAGGYGAWAGGYGAWAGGYGAWAGGYGAWAGGYGAWAGSFGDPAFAEKFVNWGNALTASPETEELPSNGTWIEFDG
jgi:subtilisin family serine protease